MQQQHSRSHIISGISFAVLATFIWSGNFIVARGVIKTIPPISLAFFRWLTATVIIIPIAWKYLSKELATVKKNLAYFIFAGITGVSMFNTFVYIAGHYSEAINLALIGTTSSPIISVILANIFLKERVSLIRVIGMLICISGILLLLSKGDLHNLLTLTFSKGDLWILTGATAFSIYNTMVKKRPANMHPVSFLATVFTLGTLLLVPFYYYEYKSVGGFDIGWSNISVILYLGIGTSVISFLLWNEAITRLGSGRTSLFGNLIPVFSSIEAVLILNERIAWIYYTSFGLVITGLIIANLQKRN